MLTVPRRLPSCFLLLSLGLALGAAESGAGAGPALTLTIHPGDRPTAAMPVAGWRHGGSLHLHWPRRESAGPAWLDCQLRTSDGRLFTAAATHRIDAGAGRWELPLIAAAWAGPEGPLNPDALAGLSELVLHLSGGTAEDAAVPVTIGYRPPTAGEARTWQLRLPAAALIQRRHWRELRFELLGRPVPADCLVAIVDGAGHRIPCFLEQPGRFAADGWQAHGDPRWVARLRPDEYRRDGWRVVVTDAEGERWSSVALLGLPAPVAEALPAAPAGSAPLRSRSRGRLSTWYRVDRPPELLHNHIAEPVVHLAPQLVWLADWTDFRGPRLVGHAAAARLDRQLPAGHTSIDLLPQRLFEEQQTFRFGLAPWHQDHGGPWQATQEAFADPQALDDLLRHARQVIARCRATPGLQQWALTAVASANSERQRVLLERFVTGLFAHIRAYDGRPLVVDHPQLRPYDETKSDRQPWFSFEVHNQRWQRVDGEHSGPRRTHPWATITSKQASHGRRSLYLPLPVTDTHTRCWTGVRCLIDANVFNLDRLEFDALLRGSGLVTLYCWVTDDEHRWYQQRLGVVRAGRHWQTIGVDFRDDAVWQSVGHDCAWDGSQRRRIRHIGINAYHQRDAVSTVVATDLFIDQLRRFGWPRSPAPELRILPQEVPPSAVGPQGLIETAFGLSVASANPYDPDHADVVAELVAPDGREFDHPAFWQEDVAVSIVDGRERLEAGTTGSWRWRFAPDRPGIWRWRLRARIRHQDGWLETVGDWQETICTADRPGGLPAIVQSPDPRYWQRDDGSFFYPIGINLRSPGDERQDALLADAGADRWSHHWEREGLAAYRDWFDDLQAHGMNYARIWMCPWWCGLEWTRAWDGFGGLTWYHQANAARLDQLVAMAAERGIYLQIELQNHGMTSVHIDHQWELSPYRRSDGRGLVAEAEDFFTSEACWEATAKRHRYVLARWGAYSHIMAWVLSSEMEFTGSWYKNAYWSNDAHDPATAAWIERSLTWFAEHDYRRRPVSIHYSHPWRAGQVWRELPLGFNNSNVYTGFQTHMGMLGGRDAGLGSAFKMYLLDYFPPWDLQRPTMVGEWGGHWAEKRSDKLAAELRVGTWLQAVLPYGGNVGFWWWLWVDATGRWPAYQAVARYMQDEDPRDQDFRPYRPAVLDTDGPQTAFVFGQRGHTQHRFYAWIRGLDRDLDKPPIADAGRFMVPTRFPDRDWRIQRHDGGSGRLVKTWTATTDGDGLLAVDLGRLAPDGVFKIDLVGPDDQPRVGRESHP